MIRYGFFAIVIVLGLLAVPGSAQENKFRYIFPGNLTYEIVPEGKTWTGQPMKATMKLVGKVGNLKDLKVFFFSSPNLKVAPSEVSLEALASGKTQTFQIEVSPGKDASQVGTWIGLTVDYLPDYSALEKTLSQKDKYPLDGSRNEILKMTASNRKSNVRVKDGTRFFFEAPK